MPACTFHWVLISDMSPDCKKVLDRLETQCSKREYCTEDMRMKALKALEGDMKGALEIVDSLVADGYVDDLRYASAFAREKAALTGWGPVKIRFALQAKKISRGIIDEALLEIDEDKASDKLCRLIEAKRKSLEGDPQIELKLIKFALGRGYEYDEIQKFL